MRKVGAGIPIFTLRIFRQRAMKSLFLIGSGAVMLIAPDRDSSLMKSSIARQKSRM